MKLIFLHTMLTNKNWQRNAYTHYNQLLEIWSDRAYFKFETKKKIKVIRNSQPLRISDTKVDMFEIVVVGAFSCCCIWCSCLKVTRGACLRFVLC